MKIGIYYFSGTGNTRYIARTIKENMKNDDCVEIYDIIKQPIVSNDLDLLIIGGPIYAGNVPEKLIRWVIRKIPESNKKTKALVYTTSAGLLNANGTDSLASKLSKKGYDIVGKECFEMPRNFYFGSYQKHDKEEIEKRTKKAHEQTKQLIDKYILVDSKNLMPIEVINKGILLKDLTAELFSVMAKFMGKNYKSDEKCIRCRSCVNNCPQQNIRLLDKGIVYGSSCMMCTKCLHICPVGAITYKNQYYEQYKQFL